MEGYDPRKPPSVRVTVLEDPNSSLQELFNPVSQRQQVPLHQRNLPKSFFVPPGDVNDNSRFQKLSSVHYNERNSTDFVVFHSKANSSPACLDAALRSSVPTNVPSHNHQKSLDVASKYKQEFSPDFAFSDSCSPGFLQTQRDTQQTPLIYRPTMTFAISELPIGYDMAINESNQVYFLNHQTQETTWFDPRIPEKFQNWGMTPEELEQVHLRYAKQFLCTNQPSNLNVCVQQVDRISPSIVPSPSAPSPSRYIGKSQSEVPSPMGATSIPPNTSTSGLPSHNLPLNSSSTCTNIQNRMRSATTVNNNNNGNNSNNVNNSQNIAGCQRSHPNQLPFPHHQHSHQTSEQLQSSNSIQHQRQHSQGLPVQSQPTSHSLVTHFRSCSQPVSMSSSQDCGSSAAIIRNPNSSSVSAATTTVTGTLCQTQLRIPGSLGGILSSSSSITGLCGSNVNTGQQGCATGSNSASSGQLVQGLECLRLNTSVSSTTALSNSSHVLLDQQQISKSQRVQQPQFILSANSGILYGSNINSAAARLIGTVLPTTPQTGNQHSHQSSMDSGVGQSLTGQSNPSANQTPEHTVMLFCDPGIGACGAEHMEGIAYPNEELLCTGFSDFDNIDISDMST
ncbi:hypothetical protein MN116_007041 [Schistosoma mekongi]|uniref:WW domain-containing protein n=1 Tax=Schistosoma mekongi TaxID=38744 RepID=A0AAE2D433_SCHME|nr:hypothetical protein MN116_007041 [Schistosoma mekongi]